MKKTVLLLLAPAFMLAACSGENYKKCVYFNDGGTTYVTEDGHRKNYYDVATYQFNDNDYEIVKSYCASGVTFPREFAIIYQAGSVNPVNGTPVEHQVVEEVALHISGYINQVFYLELKGDSEATFETYRDVYYSEASKTAKYEIHENVKTAGSKGSYTEAYSGSNVEVEGEDGKITKYKIVSDSYNLSERSFERYQSFSDTETVQYRFAE